MNYECKIFDRRGAPETRIRRSLMMIQLGLSRYQIMTKTKRRTITKKIEKPTNKYLGYKETAIFLQNWFDEVEDFKRENINPFK